jgi:capsular polysaccharide transport system permease protein
MSASQSTTRHALDTALQPLRGLWAGSAGRPALRAALLSIAAVAVYWSLLASDRYVSEAHVVVERTDAAATAAPDVASLLMNTSSNSDMLLLRDHLLSLDMLLCLDQQLQLRAHYSEHGDWLSRLWSADASNERFHRYYLSRVSVEMDEYAHVLRIRAQAYTPELAQRIAQALVSEGERFMNELAHALARNQVAFLETQVDLMAKRVSDARQQVVDYQNETGLAAPESTAQALAEITGRIESQLSEIRANRAAKLAYLSPGAAEIVQLDAQIRALEQQLQQERARLAAPSGDALNKVVERSRRLEADAAFAQDLYHTALVALERGRVEATRTIKKVSVVQTPSLPQDALEPRRLYNITLFCVIALGIAGIVQLLLAIVRDHQD